MVRPQHLGSATRRSRRPTIPPRSATSTRAFFATATDLAGNIEAAHATADTTVVVTTKPWQNATNRLDVDGDTHVVPNNIVCSITYLNGHGATTLPDDAVAGSSYYDCDGDGTAAPKDLVDIIIYLNGYGASEGEADLTPTATHQSPANTPTDADVLALLAADAALQATRPRK